MHHTLGTAAAATGLNKSTILRAIKAGKISAARNEHGEWQIDPAELHRVYPPVAATDAEQPGEQRYAPAAQRDRTDELVAELRARLDDMRNERDRARTDAETWRAAFERELAQRALPAPSNVAQGEGTTAATPTEQVSRLRRAWRWMRATGCFAGAGLLLALATMDSRAQQPQQQPQRECFAVAMSPQASIGSILVDRCTGKTWYYFAAAIPFGGSRKALLISQRLPAIAICPRQRQWIGRSHAARPRILGSGDGTLGEQTYVSMCRACDMDEPVHNDTG